MSEAHMAAWASQYTDLHRETEPHRKKGGVEARQKFHFRQSFTEDGGLGRPVRGSPEGAQPMHQGIQEGDILQFGAGLHAYQDTWSHEGLWPFGHVLRANKPDMPFRDVEKSMDMARSTYEALAAWQQKNGQQVPKWEDLPEEVRQEVRDLLSTKGKPEERVKQWQKAIEKRYGACPEGPEKEDPKHGLHQEFGRSASKVRQPEKPEPPRDEE